MQKRTRKNGEPDSPEVAAEVAAEIAAEFAALSAALPGTEDA